QERPADPRDDGRMQTDARAYTSVPRAAQAKSCRRVDPARQRQAKARARVAPSGGLELKTQARIGETLRGQRQAQTRIVRALRSEQYPRSDRAHHRGLDAKPHARGLDV